MPAQQKTFALNKISLIMYCMQTQKFIEYILHVTTL